MNREFEELVRKSEGRYLQDHEAAKMRGYAEGLVARIDTLTAIERSEETILGSAVERTMKKFPHLTESYGDTAEKKVRRDLGLGLRYAVLAMLMKDPDFVVDKLSVWLRTIMSALCNIEEVAFSYEAVLQACEEHLTAEDAAELAPYLRAHIDELKRGVPKERAA